MSFVCILRTEQAVHGMRGFSLNFASIQHILLLFFLFFPLLHSLITSSCADSCLRNTGGFWGFWLRGVWKRLKIWSRECLSENDLIDSISVSRHFTFATNNFPPAINSGLDFTPYFCTRSKASESQRLCFMFMLYQHFCDSGDSSSCQFPQNLWRSARVFLGRDRGGETPELNKLTIGDSSLQTHLKMLCASGIIRYLLLLPLIQWLITSGDSFKIIIWTKQAVPMGKLGVCVLVKKMPFSPL